MRVHTQKLGDLDLRDGVNDFILIRLHFELLYSYQNLLENIFPTLLYSYTSPFQRFLILTIRYLATVFSKKKV